MNRIKESAIIALGIIVLGFCIKSGMNDFTNRDRKVTVKGLAEKEVEADKVTWAIQTSEQGNDLPTLYNKINATTDKVKAFLKHNGVKEEEISVGAPQVSDFEADRYNTNKRTYRYNTSSTLTVTSRNVKLMRGIIARQGELLKQGVAVVNSGYYNSVKYEYVSFQDMKPKMMQEAIKNAEKTAEQFAENSNSKLNKILTADQGQFSIDDRDDNTPAHKETESRDHCHLFTERLSLEYLTENMRMTDRYSSFYPKNLSVLRKSGNFAIEINQTHYIYTMSHNLLKGKRGIIFGALNEESIAWKVAVKAVEEGATITLSNTPMALRMGELDELSKQLNAPIIAADATSVEDLNKVFEESVKLLGGKIDFVLHSIGMSPNVRKHRTYDDLDYSYLQKTLDISAISFHKMLQVAKKQDAIAEYGSVVALTYVASQRTFFGYNDMADAKSMLESIARSFGYIYGREKNVRVNTISQSPTPTTAGKGIKDMDNLMDFASKMSPLGNASAEECANYCVMMFSDFTRKVTMQNLFHDGGFSSMGMSLRAMNQYAKDLTPYEDETGKIIYG